MIGLWFKDNRKLACGIGAGVLVTIGVIITVWALFFATHRQEVTITDFYWHRQMEVQDFQPRRRGDWYGTPDDAYDVSSSYLYHYTRQVYDGETCTDTGTSRSCTSNYHSEAVYDWWYDYTVDRWEFSEWLATSAQNHTPLWAPIENEHFDTTPVFGHRRLSGVRKESYTVYFKTKSGKVYQTRTNERRWKSVEIGQSANLNLNRQDDIRSVNWPSKN